MTIVDHWDDDVKHHWDDDVKQGSKCCGFCCDMRRATIVLNALQAVLELFYFIGAIATDYTMGLDLDGENDHVIRDNIKLTAILGAISFVFYVLGVWGGIRYNIYPVMLASLIIVVRFIVDTALNVQTVNEYNDRQAEIKGEDRRFPIGQIVFSGVITLLFVYPMMSFVLEVKAGIMTPETYHREKYSCCCT